MVCYPKVPVDSDKFLLCFPFLEQDFCARIWYGNPKDVQIGWSFTLCGGWEFEVIMGD